MKRKRHTEEQIIAILKEHAGGCLHEPAMGEKSSCKDMLEIVCQRFRGSSREWRLSVSRLLYFVLVWPSRTISSPTRRC